MKRELPALYPLPIVVSDPWPDLDPVEERSEVTLPCADVRFAERRLVSRNGFAYHPANTQAWLMLGPRRIAFLLLVFYLLAAASCGPGWKGYASNYELAGPPPGGLWTGTQTVFVKLGQTTVKVPLAGMEVVEYKGASGVSLSQLVLDSAVASDPSTYCFDFTATDKYDLLIKRYSDPTQLPTWDDMKNGVLYLDPRYNDLTCGWNTDPWGDALSAYWVKFMNGGTITLLPLP